MPRLQRHPKIAAIVFDDGENAVVKKSVFDRVTEKLTVFVTHETAAVSAESKTRRPRLRKFRG